MAEPSSSSSSKTKGKKKKLPTWSYFAIAGGAGLVYYLYKQHSANSAASSAAAPSTNSGAIDPLTGAPYQPGVGSLAPSASGSASSSTDPFQAIDPSTGVSYAQDIQNLIAQGLSTSQAVQQVSGQMGGLQNTVGGLQNQVGGLGTQVSGLGTDVGTLGNQVGGLQTTDQTILTDLGGLMGQGTTHGKGSAAALRTWRLSKAQTIAKAMHITVGEAAQAISQYLQGKPITNAAAARGISNVVKNSGPPPTPTGHHLPIRVARTPAHLAGPTAATLHHGA